MSVALASSLYDITKGSIFGSRNVDKTAKGDFVRAGVAAGQFRNAARVLGECETEAKYFTVKSHKFNRNFLFRKVKTLSDSFDALAKEKSLWGYTAKGVNIASKYINPLICVSGAYKVAKADDKDSEAIKQTCALGSMFTFEKTAKSILTEAGRSNISKKALGQTKLVKKLMRLGRRLDGISNNSKLLHVKYGIPIAKALGFIGMSITGYTIGSSIGNKINEIRKSNPQKLVQDIPTQKLEVSA